MSEADDYHISELERRCQIMNRALTAIADYDGEAQERFNKTGDFEEFNEPVSARAARVALMECDAPSLFQPPMN